MNLRLLIMLLRSLIINSAVLNDWNCEIGRPIAIVGNNAGVLKKTACMISPAPVFTNHQSVKQLQHEVKGLNSQAIICELPPIKKNPSSKLQEYMECILTLGCFGNIGKSHTYAPVFFISVDELPEVVEKTALVINIGDSKLDEGDIGDMLELLPSEADFMHIKAEISTFTNDRAYPLKAATAFALPRLKALGRVDEYNGLLDLCDYMVNMDEFLKSGQGLLEKIEVTLIEALSDDAQKKMRLPSVNNVDEELFSDCIFFDKNYIFISEKKFKDVFDGYIKLWGADNFKRKLRDAGVIQSDLGGYTSKMRFIMNRDKCEKRMVRISLDNLDRVACCLI